MPRYHNGDVVIVRFPFSEDHTQDKIRPGIILEEPFPSDAENYLVCKITSSKPNSVYHPIVQPVKLDSKEGKTMGLLQDSYVVYNAIERLEVFLIIKKIGYCPFFKEILPFSRLARVLPLKHK